jgi:steroid delta-isomerase-like uncharacterized protein
MREITYRWIEQGWQKGDVGIVDQCHSPDFIDHDSAGRSSDNEGFKQGITRLYAAFPDLTAQVSELVVDTETGTVAVRWSATGTHQRAYLGAQPSGKSINFKGIEIIRIRNDRIIERWGEWDGIDLLEQLGLVEL